MADRADKIRCAATAEFLRARSNPTPLQTDGKWIYLTASVKVEVGSGKHAILLALICDVVQKAYVDWWLDDDLCKLAKAQFLGHVKKEKRSPFFWSAVKLARKALKRDGFIESSARKGDISLNRNTGVPNRLEGSKNVYALTASGVQAALVLYNNHAQIVAYQENARRVTWAAIRELPTPPGAGAGAGCAAGGAAGGGTGAGGGGRSGAGAGGAGAGSPGAAAASPGANATTAVAAAAARADALTQTGRLLFDNEHLFSLLVRLYAVAPQWSDVEVLTLNLEWALAGDEDGAFLVQTAVERSLLERKDGGVRLWPSASLPGLTAADVTYVREAIFCKVRPARRAGEPEVAAQAGVKRSRAAA